MARGPDTRAVRRAGTGGDRSLDHPGGDQPLWRQRGSLPRADVHHGHAAQARLRGSEKGVPAEDSLRRAQVAGFRRHRARGRNRYDTHRDLSGAGGWPLRYQRAQELDFALQAFRPDDVAGADDTLRGARKQDRRYERLSTRPLYAGDRDQAQRDHDQLRHQRGFFRNARVPAENLIGEEGKGFRYILDGMNVERILVASESIGDGRWFVERASAYASERVVFGRPIGQNQGVQFPIARAFASVEAASMMRYKAASLFDAGEKCGAEANMSKLLASEAAWEAANAAVQTFGGYGFRKDYDVERKFRESRIFMVAPVSNNLVLSYIGQHVLGMPRSY